MVVKYPDQVCHECATEAGGKISENHLSSVNLKGTCEICHQQKPTTDPRDYGFPVFTRKREVGYVEEVTVLVRNSIRTAIANEIAEDLDVSARDVLNKLTVVGLL